MPRWASRALVSLILGAALAVPGIAFAVTDEDFEVKTTRNLLALCMERDRFDYIQVIATSWKQQTLLNIVKLRHADTPVFLDVTQVIGSYQLQAGVSVGGGVNFGKNLVEYLELWHRDYRS